MEYLANGGVSFGYLTNRAVNGPNTTTGIQMELSLALQWCKGAYTNHQNGYFNGLEDVLNRPWISRLWTLQEALLSQEAVIVCGKKEVPWLAMVHAIEQMSFVSSKGFTGSLTFPIGLLHWRRLQLFWLRYHGRVGLQRGDAPQTMDRTNECKMLLQVEKHMQSLNKAWAYFRFLYFGLFALWLWMVAAQLSIKGIPGTILLLTELFSVLRGFQLIFSSRRQLRLSLPDRDNDAIITEALTRQCQKPKDRYYGLLGVIGDGMRSFPTPITLNYSSSLSDTYHELFIDLLHYTKSLDLLLFTSHDKFSDSPSWVIDWRSASQRWSKARYWTRTIWWVAARDWPQFRAYKYSGATLESTSVWNFRTRNQLVVHGRVIGGLVWSSGRIEAISDLSTSRELLENIQSFQIPLTCFGSHFQKKVARALSQFVEIHTDICEGPAWKGWYQILGQPTVDKAYSIVHQLRSCGRRWPAFYNAWDFHQRLSSILSREEMVLASCSATGYASGYSGIGIAPRTSRGGDVVALISGMSMPVVLRQGQGGYEFVGPIFLPGTMEGEVWKNIDEDNLDEIVLV
ncbi:hypothetical protein JX265_006729 [Neoarthrinium moseri]|uniref:Heterokaryon incompatibility domain-containing protein n=1 Tax=Neoarthrinium moseri TaxID=1658444 RepID=A0A9Q0ANN0_9PEZI|nr:hypothetical protein JX265_006729 [Neoarthrinium moseri]